MLFLCVSVYCHRVTTQLQLINIIIIIIIVQVWYNLFTCSDISSLVGGRVCSVLITIKFLIFNV